MQIIDLPPFIDTSRFPEAPDRSSGGEPALVAVAMMRSGDKLASYAVLAEALALMQDRSWRLTIVGDGPARAAVETLFAPFDPARIRWAGALPSDGVLHELARADIYAWPGIGEAFGLGYLEAAAMALPVVAFDTAGVSSVVCHDVTGLLAEGNGAPAFAAALSRLMGNAPQRLALGHAAARWVRDERTLGRAAQTLSRALAAAADVRAAHV